MRLGMNLFAAMTVEEYSEKYLTSLKNHNEVNYADKEFTASAVPESVNWTAKGAVTPVED
jgi:hypothetical protein